MESFETISIYDFEYILSRWTLKSYGSTLRACRDRHKNNVSIDKLIYFYMKIKCQLALNSGQPSQAAIEC